MALDPEFATGPFEVKNLNIPAFMRTDWLEQQIASIESDVNSFAAAAAGIREELPKMQRDLLVFERDAAEGRLKLYELRAELESKQGGIL